MDYETADGSQFSLREIWTEDYEFSYTSATAIVNGKAFAAKFDKEMDLLDDAQIFEALHAVPLENIYPLFPANFTKSPPFDSSRQYLKAPSFTYDDCGPGKTFVADCLLNEASILERLKTSPHKNLATYHGCVVEDGRITRLCLTRYPFSLTEYLEKDPSENDKRRIMDGIEAGVLHLHSLGLAHNDVNPDNICIDGESGEGILIDFDSCLPFGEKLMKGVGQLDSPSSDAPVSDRGNDFDGLDMVHDFLWDQPPRHE